MKFDQYTLHNEYPEMQPDRRLRELILHIAKISTDDRWFGKVKLAKLLYFSDRESFRAYGLPITGVMYKKLPQGPVPNIFFDLLDEMESAGDIVIVKERVEAVDNDRQRVMALKEPDLTIFTGRDIALVEEILRQFKTWTGKRISEYSHGIAWRQANMNEPISYESGLLSDEKLDEEEIEYAQRLLELDGR